MKEYVIFLLVSLFLIRSSIQNRFATITSLKSANFSPILLSYNNKLYSFVSYIGSAPELYEYDKTNNSFNQITEYCSIFPLCENTNMLVFAKYFEEQKRNVFVFVKEVETQFYIEIILDNPYTVITPEITVKLNTIPYVTFINDDIMLLSLKAFFLSEYRLTIYKIPITGGKSTLFSQSIYGDCYVQCEGISETQTYCASTVSFQRSLVVLKVFLLNGEVYLDNETTIKVDYPVNGVTMKKGKRKIDGKEVDALIICYEYYVLTSLNGKCTDLLTMETMFSYQLDNFSLQTRNLYLEYDGSFKLIISHPSDSTSSTYSIYNLENQQKITYNLVEYTKIEKYTQLDNKYSFLKALSFDNKLYLLLLNNVFERIELNEMITFETHAPTFYVSTDIIQVGYTQEKEIFYKCPQCYHYKASYSLSVAVNTVGSFLFYYHYPSDNQYSSFFFSSIIIHVLPNYCILPTDDDSKCNICSTLYKAKQIYYFKEEQLCYASDEIPDGYFGGDNHEVLPCSDNCIKCIDGKTCIECKEDYKIDSNNQCRYNKCEGNAFMFNGVCMTSCPEGYIGALLEGAMQCLLSKEVIKKSEDIEDNTDKIKEFEESQNKEEEIANTHKEIIDTEITRDNLVSEMNKVILYNEYANRLDESTDVKEMTNSVANTVSSSISKLIPFEQENEIVISLTAVNTTLQNINQLEGNSISELKETHSKLSKNVEMLLENSTIHNKEIFTLQVMTSELEINSKFIDYTVKNNSNDESYNDKKFKNSMVYKYQKGMMCSENNKQTINDVQKSALLSMKLSPNASFTGSEYEILSNTFDIEQGVNITNTMLGLSIITDNYIQSKRSDSLVQLIRNEKINTKIVFPLEALKNKYNAKIGYIGIITYKHYPYLNPNMTNTIYDSFFSVKIYDKEYKEIKVSNLTEDIKIISKIKNKRMNQCIFFDEALNNINSEQCSSEVFDDYIICSCNHLTDFSFASFNPVNIIKDISKLFNDVRIINSFEQFKLLTWSNAIILYIYIGITIIYIIGVIFTVKYDLRSREDSFVMIVTKDNKCCSKEEIEEEIYEIKNEVNEEITKQFFLKEIKNREKTQSIILKNLGIKITGLNEEKDENLEEDNKGKEEKNDENGKKGHLLNFDDENWEPPKRKRKNLFQSIINKRKRESFLMKEKEEQNNNSFPIEEKPKTDILIEMTSIDTSSNKKEQSTNVSDISSNSSKRRNAISIPKNTTPKDPPFYYSSYLIFLSLFTKEYRPYTLVSEQTDFVMCKTNIFTLIIVRLIAGLSICSLFSRCNTKSQENETYVNRDLAVAFATILIIEIPFTFFEVLLCKTKIPIKLEKQRKSAEKFKAILITITVYVLFFAISIFGLLNTTWISLVADEQNASCNFLLDFSLNVLMDNLVYEIGILIIKSLIYTFLIKSTKASKLQMCLISFVAALPWVFAVAG